MAEPGDSPPSGRHEDLVGLHLRRETSHDGVARGYDQESGIVKKRPCPIEPHPTQPPATSLQPPVSSLQPPVSSHQPPVSSLQPPVSSLQPPVSSHQPPVSSHQPTWVKGALARHEVVVDEDTGASYRAVAFIGRGGMGDVYEVRRVESGERFAIKCIRMNRIHDPKMVERARREGAVLRSLRHKHVVPVYGMGVRGDGLVWILMKLLRGWTGGELLRRMGKLPIPWALELTLQVCLGLEAIHPFAVHRDIKLENIHLDSEAVVRVLDLGTAKFANKGVSTTGGYSIGTLEYMSPEQITKPETLDVRSDLFSTGIVLYKFLTGKHPFVHEDVADDVQLTGAAIVSRPLRPLLEWAPYVPSYVRLVVERALEKDRERRYSCAHDMAFALRSALRRMEAELGVLPPLRMLCASLEAEDMQRGAAVDTPAATPDRGTERMVPMGQGPRGTDLMTPLRSNEERGAKRQASASSSSLIPHSSSLDATAPVPVSSFIRHPSSQTVQPITQQMPLQGRLPALPWPGVGSAKPQGAAGHPAKMAPRAASQGRHSLVRGALRFIRTPTAAEYRWVATGTVLIWAIVVVLAIRRFGFLGADTPSSPVVHEVSGAQPGAAQPTQGPSTPLGTVASAAPTAEVRPSSSATQTPASSTHQVAKPSRLPSRVVDDGVIRPKDRPAPSGKPQPMFKSEERYDRPNY